MGHFLYSAYHGHSVSVIDMSPYKFRNLSEDGQKDYIHVIPQPDCYRGEHCGSVDDPAIGEAYADDAINIINDAVANGREVCHELLIFHTVCLI